MKVLIAALFSEVVAEMKIRWNMLCVEVTSGRSVDNQLVVGTPKIVPSL